MDYRALMPSSDSGLDSVVIAGRKHRVDDLDARRGAANIMFRMFGGERKLPKVGRYRIRERLGTGGCATVYRAYDPALGRDVALKLLALAGAEDGRRMAREARALARLSHPNVVEVYDYGQVGGYVYVAMELIEGPTLAQWLAQSQPAAEVVRVFADAGRGLLAAHHAGLVHRDFKPTNVMLSNDGRVRVLDFGIARTFRSQSVPGDADPICAAYSYPTDAPITHEGLVSGTPLYMAPEQHAGVVDARSDQFAFCTALFGALAGRNPFGVHDAAGLAKAKCEASYVANRPPDGVPRWLWPVMMRGLEPDPNRRWPTMETLVVRLERGPLSSRMRSVALISGLCVAALAGFGSFNPSSDPCQSPVASLARNEDERTTLRDEVAAANPDFRPVVVDQLVASLAAYDQEWRHEVRLSCRTQHRRGPSADAEAPAREECLTAAKSASDTLRAMLVRAGSDALIRGGNPVAWLPSLHRCRRPTSLDADSGFRPGAPTTTPAALAEASFLVSAVQLEDARHRIQAIRSGAKDGLPPSLEASVTVLEARVAYAAGDWATGAKLAENAFLLARAGQSRWIAFDSSLLAARALVQSAQQDQARPWLRRAAAELGADPSPDVDFARLLVERASVDAAAGHLGSAERHATEAQAILEPALGRAHPYTLGVVVQLAVILARDGRAQDARDVSEDVIDRIQSEDRAPQSRLLQRYLVASHEVLGGTLAQLGDFERSIEVSKAGLNLARQVFGPAHPVLFSPTNNIGHASLRLGRLRDAEHALEAAAAMARRHYGSQHPLLGTATLNLGIVYFSSERMAAAHQALSQACRIFAANDGPAAARDLVSCRLHQARALDSEGDVVAAADARSKALRALDRSGEDAPTIERFEAEVEENFTVPKRDTVGNSQ